MKKAIIIVLLTALIEATYCQDSTLPKIENDTLFTTSGYKIVKKQMIKIGTGTMPDGDFKYIRASASSIISMTSTHGDRSADNARRAFPRHNSGTTFPVRRIDKLGNKKHGYVYYAKIGSAIIDYEIDVENAIASGEIVVPEEYKPKPKNQVIEVKQQISVADELAKLKKLLNDSTLTKEEYEAQKKKILDNN